MLIYDLETENDLLLGSHKTCFFRTSKEHVKLL